jgi:hypothetical protein
VLCAGNYEGGIGNYMSDLGDQVGQRIQGQINAANSRMAAKQEAHEKRRRLLRQQQMRAAQRAADAPLPTRLPYPANWWSEVPSHVHYQQVRSEQALSMRGVSPGYHGASAAQRSEHSNSHCPREWIEGASAVGAAVQATASRSPEEVERAERLQRKAERILSRKTTPSAVVSLW